MRLPNSCTSGANGRARANCRRRAIGASGYCSPAAALARRAPARNMSGRASNRARAASRWSDRLSRMPRDIMVGDSGILAVSPPAEGPRYVPSKRRVVWPNGAIAALYSADEPRRLRGPQHDTAWCDELAAWRYPETWDMLMFGLRAGTDPRGVVTTTPRPIRLLRELLADPKVAVTRGTTYDNRKYLAPAFFSQIVRKYEGTRLGRQELQAEILEDLPGALWSRGLIEACRASQPPADLVRVVVAIDPAARATETANETGIIVAGKNADGNGWVLADASGRYSPTEWAKAAIAAYRAHRADRIVAEINNGGDMDAA